MSKVDADDRIMARPADARTSKVQARRIAALWSLPPLNCGAKPTGLLESVRFGREKSAFADAEPGK